MQDSVQVLAALGVFAAFALIALSATTMRAATLRGWPVGLAVALAFPPFCVVTAPISVFAAVTAMPAETRARGGGFFKSGTFGGLSVAGLLAALAITLLAIAGGYGVGRALEMSGEPAQMPVVQALIIGGLAGGVLTALLSRRVGFLEALWVTAFASLVPVVLSGKVAELFTYGTAPAYYAVILITANLILLLCLVLGGSIGFLMFGDGEIQPSWSYESFIGRRFLMGKRGDSVVGIITVISVLAVAVGTCAMVVVMSVMNGFSTDLRSKIFGANAHLIVLKYGTDFTEYDDVVKKTKDLRGVTGATPFVLNEVMVSSDTNLTGALLKGIDTTTVDSVTVLRSNMTTGKLEHLDTPDKIPQPTPLPEDGGKPSGAGPAPGAPSPGAPSPTAPGGLLGPPAAPGGGPADSPPVTDQLDAAMAAATQGILPDPASRAIPGIVIGVEMSKNLKVFVGDVINVVSPVGELGPSGPVPKARAFRVAGLFYSGMYEYDSKFIYIALKEAQDFFTLNGAVTGVEYKVEDVEQTQGVAQAMLKALGGYPYRTKDWMEMNRNLFSALKLEKIAMFIILTFIIIVASFLIAATLIVFVIEKSKEIAILKTMGATDTAIMKVFITYGVTVGSLGTVVGIIAGLSLCFLIKTFGIGLDPDVYYITNLPVAVEPFEVALVGVAAMVLSYLATIYPALIAARLRPVEGLRYE